MHELAGILATRRLVETAQLSAEQMLRASFNRAHASQSSLKAFAYLPPQLTLTVLDRQAPLAGVAVAVKDLIDTADMPTSYGSPIYHGYVPSADAWIVQRLRAQGAHVVGKSVTTEFAWRHPGPTVNPWQAGHTPGGSSSGSAAAVGAGIVPLAIGTQTLGSVIRPAAFCGVVGFKPTFGAIPRTGVQALSSSLDHIGIFTRDVPDAIYAVGLLIGTSTSDPHGHAFPRFSTADDVPVLAAPPVIAVLTTPQLGITDDDQARTMQGVVLRLRQRGATVCEVRLPAIFDAAADVTARLAAAEAAHHHRRHLEQFRHLLSTPMTALLDQGAAMTPAQVDTLRSSQRDLQDQYARWWLAARIDALLVPPAQGTAPRGLDYTGDAKFCSPFTLAGVPAITLPAGHGANGLPLGVQLVGAAGQDLLLLRVAAWCERAIARIPAIATGWH